jgi:hypothetical protein
MNCPRASLSLELLNPRFERPAPAVFENRSLSGLERNLFEANALFFVQLSRNLRQFGVEILREFLQTCFDIAGHLGKARLKLVG